MVEGRQRRLAGDAQSVEAGQAPQRRGHRPREHVVVRSPANHGGGGATRGLCRQAGQRRADGEEAKGATQNALRRLRVKGGNGVPPGNYYNEVRGNSIVLLGCHQSRVISHPRQRSRREWRARMKLGLWGYGV